MPQGEGLANQVPASNHAIERSRGLDEPRAAILQKREFNIALYAAWVTGMAQNSKLAQPINASRANTADPNHPELQPLETILARMLTPCLALDQRPRPKA